ncbi:ferredoxin [Bordetella trematum]|uniref:Flagellin N-methylase n=1 Tax=Bordetella trematum TaxID=123899 RepID=A0A157RM14_9BORD|nr:YkgJ family cysteine cluster protein [Bordetella trematum]AUL48311.1 zinc/iron-chelating domain-containing protein [Bordetella trematum]AZR95272.1 ferredoxin [Bordetella trematum]NNH18183.1 YkgJ family cysteine cluster protein [Bordetella trematum]QIM70220.1 YkgJ family cysteine cluster protein [Bordetella trematum]SAI49343.1 Flagellin N-methylase [Bordetella trematum]
MTRLTPDPVSLISLADLTGQPDSNPCLNCGACCAHFRVSFYFGEVDGANGGTVPEALVTPVNAYRVCMKGTEQGGQRCVALRGELGQPGIHCAIYALRPTPCREFDIWQPDGSPNPDCQRLRMQLGLPALPRRPEAENDPQGPGTPSDQPHAA